MTLADRVYLARYYEIDGPTYMGMVFNRSQQAICALIKTMKNNGEYDLYRSLSEGEYEKILKCAEAKHGAIENDDDD